MVQQRANGYRICARPSVRCVSRLFCRDPGRPAAARVQCSAVLLHDTHHHGRVQGADALPAAPLWSCWRPACLTHARQRNHGIHFRVHRATTCAAKHRYHAGPGCGAGCPDAAGAAVAADAQPARSRPMAAAGIMGGGGSAGAGPSRGRGRSRLLVAGGVALPCVCCVQCDATF